MTGSASKILSTEPLDVQEARWITLSKTTYSDPLGQTRTWESASRLTRPSTSQVDGVGIVAILQYPASDPSGASEQQLRRAEILLQKQFRPPVDKVVVEVPAGLIDKGESPQVCALRELKEETGYVGEIVSSDFGVSPVMFNDPGFCNTNLNMVHVTVDMSRPENRSPKPELEESEFIECFTVPLTDLYAECRRLEREGLAIDARVGTLAEGIEIAKRWRLAD